MKEKIHPEDLLRKQTDKLRELANIAETLGCTLNQLSIAWCLKNECIQCVLVGASTVEQMLDQLEVIFVSTENISRQVY